MSIEDPFGEDMTELQRDIVNAYDRNPDAGPSEIAEICDCSDSYARETLNEYRSGFGSTEGVFGSESSGGGSFDLDEGFDADTPTGEAIGMVVRVFVLILVVYFLSNALFQILEIPFPF